MSDRVAEIAEAVEAMLQRRFAVAGKRADIVVGLIGRGIEFSRTPAMHEREAARLGLTCSYLLLDFDVLGLVDSDVEAALEAARRLGFNGVNVTYPFKQAVITLLDDISPEAETIGAVNTVVLGSRMVGHNTDYWGFSESFRMQMAGVAMGHVTMFGAGGAGSAVGAALIGLGARHVTIADTDRMRAAELARRLDRIEGVNVSVAADVRDAVENADGIVNTTPVGMAKHPGTPFPTEWLSPRQWVADVVYFPRETALLRDARLAGCRTLPGIGMAIGQAVRAFEHFTGRPADMSSMANHFEAAA